MAETMESPGGVYALCCRKSGTRLLCATVDMQKERQWFLVCQEEGHCPKCELEKEWTAYGPSAFTFEIVERVPKNRGRNQRPIGRELKRLKSFWRCSRLDVVKK